MLSGRASLGVAAASGLLALSACGAGDGAPGRGKGAQGEGRPTQVGFVVVQPTAVA